MIGPMIFVLALLLFIKIRCGELQIGSGHWLFLVFTNLSNLLARDFSSIKKLQIQLLAMTIKGREMSTIRILIMSTELSI